MAYYKVANPSQYLAITGCGIEDVKLAKKAWILPGQKCRVVDMSPVNYTIEVHAMSSEKLAFLLPAIFTIGPRPDDEASLIKYAKLLASNKKLFAHTRELVQGIIEGETRVLAASMTMEEIFMGTKPFKLEVFGKVQLELDQFGLLIYNANVKQLVDVAGQEYFSFLGQKIQQGAANQAKIDVAEARKKGNIGKKERNGETRRNLARIDVETDIYATQREGECRKAEISIKTGVKIFEFDMEAEVAAANADLTVKKAGWARQAKVAEVEASKAVAIRKAELEMEVERRNASKQIEKLKAEFLSKALVEYEMKVQEANWELYMKQKEADASLYEQEKAADGQRATAEAAFFASQQEADAELYAQKKEAESMLALAEAQGVYLNTLLDACGGSYETLRDYMMIDREVYQDIAMLNSECIFGLEPEISVWTDSGRAVELRGGSGNAAAEEVAGLLKMLPAPLLKTVEEQTGMLPFPWMGTALVSSNGP